MGQEQGKSGAVTEGRAKERAQEIKETVAAKTPPSPETLKRNPAPTAAIGALLAGFVIGWVLASRRTG